MDPEILSEPRSGLWCSLEPDERFFRLESAAYLSVSAGRLNLPEKLPILWHKLYALLCCPKTSLVPILDILGSAECETRLDGEFGSLQSPSPGAIFQG